MKAELIRAMAAVVLVAGVVGGCNRASTGDVVSDDRTTAQAATAQNEDGSRGGGVLDRHAGAPGGPDIDTMARADVETPGGPDIEGDATLAATTSADGATLREAGSRGGLTLERGDGGDGGPAGESPGGPDIEH